MFRAAARSTPRALRQSTVASPAGRRLASTTPADKRYTWKGTAARWGLAIGALYWYNTSQIFADELPSRLSPEPAQFSESDLTTVDAVVKEKRRQLDARLKAKQERAAKDAAAAEASEPSTTTSPPPPPPEKNDTTAVATPADAEKSPEQLEEEAGNQGAFNPETGEINWDCPCLGGMAHGPCGEEFKAAFSCFVYSDEEPKGMDCIDKFQHMQDCFRKYPDVYGAEIADEDAAEAETGAAAAAAAAGSSAPAANASDAAGQNAAPVAPAMSDEHQGKSDKTVQAPEKPTKSSRAAHEDATEEHKAGATDPVGQDDSQVSEERMDGEARGVPRRSFDATPANAKDSK